MKTIPLIFSDLLSVALILYVWVRMAMYSALEPRAVHLFRNIGITLLTTLALDHVWEYFYEIPHTAPELLNTISSVEFLCIPVSLFFLLMYHRRQWDAADTAALAAVIGLFAADLANIWIPVYSITDKNLYFVNTSGAKWVYLGTLFLLGFILVHDFLRPYHTDSENQVLISFTLIIAALGGAGCYIIADVVALWECLSIVYLLLYLALERVFDKTDQVTGMPNRNAFTLDYFKVKRNPASVLVLVDLNHLKYFNDCYGHGTGDRYLRAFAQTAQLRLKDLGQIYRVGGDEFCLTSSADPLQVQAAFEALSDMDKCDPAFGDFPMDFAYGLAVRQPGEANGALYTRADAAMYAHKRQMEQTAGRRRGE